MDAEFRNVPIEQVRESATNPRRNFKAMEELTASVMQHGVLVPLLVRPINGALDSQSKNALAIRGTHIPSLEIIAGARRYRAARSAGLQEIPVRVKEIGDTEALEIQVIENIQREDVHPLEEALGYQALLDRPGYDVAAIAGKVGRSESYVYQRLKLIDLVDKARDAFLADEITAGHAILLARLQSKDQLQALEASFDRYVKDSRGRPVLCSVRELSAWIQRNIHLDLHGAPWKKDGADLVPAAGPCTTCPKRTGFVPQLFPDIAHKDTCTDRGCYEEKLQAHISRVTAELERRGETVLRLSRDNSYNLLGKDAKGIFPSDMYAEVKPKNRCEHTQHGIIVHGYADQGKVLEVCTDKKCKKHFDRGGYEKMPRDPKVVDEEKRREAAERRERERRRRIMAAVIDAVPGRLGRRDLDLVACALLRKLQGKDIESLSGRYGWQPGKTSWGGKDWQAGAEKRIPLLSDGDLQRLLIEACLHQDLQVWRYSSRGPCALLETAERYEVDVAAIEENLDMELAEKREKKAKNSKGVEKKAKDSKTETASEKAKADRMKAYWAGRRKKETAAKGKK